MLHPVRILVYIYIPETSSISTTNFSKTGHQIAMEAATRPTRTCTQCRKMEPASAYLKDGKVMNTCPVCRVSYHLSLLSHFWDTNTKENKSAAAYHKRKAEREVIQQQQNEVLAHFRGHNSDHTGDHTEVETRDCIYCHKTLPKSAFETQSSRRILKSCATCRVSFPRHHCHPQH